MYYTNAVADDSYPARKTSVLRACKCQDNRVENLMDSQRGRRQAPRRSSRLGSQVALAELICPLHGISDDLQRFPSPPWERVAAAGQCRRSCSQVPHNRHARWDLSERLLGACKKEHLANEPPLSPGYGWAEPGKGWNRCSSRSRTHQRRATPRPRVFPRHVSKGAAWPQRVCLEQDPPQATAYTPPAEPRRSRDSNRCTATIEGVSSERADRSWAKSTCWGVPCAPQSRQTGQDATGARVVRQVHQRRMAAPAVGKHPAVFKGGDCRLEEAQNMKHVRRRKPSKENQEKNKYHRPTSRLAYSRPATFGFHIYTVMSMHTTAIYDRPRDPSHTSALWLSLRKLCALAFKCEVRRVCAPLALCNTPGIGSGSQLQQESPREQR